MSDILLEIENISVHYSGELAINDVNLKIYKNDFIGIVGPNGGGKTTLIKAMLGLVKPSKGVVKYSIAKNSIGYLPQINHLDKNFPITVIDVVLSGKIEKSLYLFSKLKSENLSKAKKLLHEFGALHFADKAFGDLSGGQMQRVLLCRALMGEPQLLVLDEPNTYIDNKFENELYSMLKELNKRMAIILISHDVGMISSYVKTIACVNKNLHYHKSNKITTEQLNAYNCPLQIISHGDVPHTILSKHN